MGDIKILTDKELINFIIDNYNEILILDKSDKCYNSVKWDYELLRFDATSGQLVTNTLYGYVENNCPWRRVENFGTLISRSYKLYERGSK